MPNQEPVLRHTWTQEGDQKTSSKKHYGFIHSSITAGAAVLAPGSNSWEKFTLGNAVGDAGAALLWDTAASRIVRLVLLHSNQDN